MAMDYTRHITTPRNKTPQTQRAHADQVKNHAGGYAFKVDCWTQLNRFLILGCEGGSYYVNERKAVLENVKCLDECIKTDGPRTVREIVAVSKAGRANKNDHAIFALAYCARAGAKEEAELQEAYNRDRTRAALSRLSRCQSKYQPTRRAAFAAVKDVCRIGTHLFQFADAIDKLGGWGRGPKAAISDWYLSTPVKRLALQTVKYQQRDGWSHRDLLRLAHVKGPKTGTRADILQYIAKPDTIEFTEDCHEDIELVYAAERAKRADSVREVVGLIEDYNIPRECVPTQFLNDPKVWEAMLANGMPMGALLRNLAKMTAVGVIAPLSQGMKQVVTQLTNQEALVRARIHPMKVIAAYLTYRNGRGFRGNLTWTPVQAINDALDSAFYASFGAIEPTGKNFLIGIDVSGSMRGPDLDGIPGLSPHVGATVMAMVAARTEPWAHVVGFCHRLEELNITASTTFDQAMQLTQRYPFGGTDCSLLFDYALKNRMEVDCFVTITDNETWAGRRGHPYQVLSEYRRRMRRAARSVVMGMTATPFSIADPNDAGSLDVAGFDTGTPQLISEFARGSF